MKQLAWYSVKNKSHESTDLLSCGFSFYTHNLVRHLLSFSSGWNGSQKIIPCLAPWPLDFKTPMMGTPLRPWDIDCFHCKKFLSYIKMKSLWVQLVPFACCPLSVCPCEERAFMLFVAAFWELENYDGILLSLFFSRVKRANPSGPSPQNGSPALWSPLWSSFEPSPMSVCLFWMVHTRTGHSTAGVAWQVLTRLGWSQLSLCQLCSMDAAQDPICLPCSSSPLWAHVILSTRVSRSLSARLLLRQMDSSLSWELWLCHPRGTALHLSLLNFILFFLSHSSSLASSPCKIMYRVSL